MAEYKNGFNAFGGIPVDSSRRSSDLQTGRAVYVNEDEYSDEPDYKNRVDQTVNEGYHREAPFEAPEIVVPEPIIPSGTKNITENGTYDVAQFAKANVNVAGGGSSDFNKAMVTVVNNHNSILFDIVPMDALSGGDKVIGFKFGDNGVVSDSEYFYESGTSVTDTFYIYQDYSMTGHSETLTDPNFYTVTGDAEIISVQGAPFPVIRIFGDCTITIS